MAGHQRIGDAVTPEAWGTVAVGEPQGGRSPCWAKGRRLGSRIHATGSNNEPHTQPWEALTVLDAARAP